MVNPTSDNSSALPAPEAGSALNAPELVRLRETAVYRATDFAGQALLGLAETSRRTYRSRYNQVAVLLGFGAHAPGDASHAERQAIDRDAYREVPWQALRAHHIRWLRQQLLDSAKSYRTINLTLVALRAVAREVFLTGQMSGDDLKRIELVKGVSGSRLPTGRHVQSGEVLAVAQACARDETPAGVRDEALFALLYAGGLRRREVAALTLEDLGTDDDGERAIRLVGKGNKERWNWPGEGAWTAVDRWLAIRGDAAGPLFHPVHRGGAIRYGRGISDQSIYNAVLKRVKEAGLTGATTPHDLRRTFVSELLDQGKDMKTVSSLAGHASVETTAIYDRREDRVRREAQSGLHWPCRVL